MRNPERHCRRPCLEPLETRVALSGAGSSIALRGTVRGSYFATRALADVGSMYQFGTSGKLSPLGRTAETARVQTTGFIASGMAVGVMFVGSRRGTLTLDLAGPVQPGFAPLPSTLSYTIQGGTRSYRAAAGSGTIAVVLDPSGVSNDFGQVTFSFRAGSSATITPTL